MPTWTPEQLAAPAPTGDARAEFDALRAGRGVFRRDPADRLDLTGSDAADLLHRLCASEVRELPVGSAVRVVFTDDKGRILDLPLLCATETGLSLLAGDGRGSELRAWLERFIIAEDVTVAPAAARLALGLVGEDALQAAADAVDDLVERDDSWEQADVLLAAENALGPTLGHLEVESARGPDLLDALAAQDLVPAGAEALRAWRISTGRVLPGPAVTVGANPLEAGLKHLVSFTKGCYVGQEVVARLDTYDKVRRRVAWWDSDTVPAAGDPLIRDGKKVGAVWEAAPRLGADGARALVLAASDLEDGAELECGGQRGVLCAVPA